MKDIHKCPVRCSTCYPDTPNNEPPMKNLREVKIQTVSAPIGNVSAIDVIKNPPKLETVPVIRSVREGEASRKANREALEWALMCAQEVVDRWPTLTLRTLGTMTKTIDTLKEALSKVNLDKTL